MEEAQLRHMDILLWRHAEAEDKLEGQDDMARRLTSRGLKQAKRVGRWLKGHCPKDVRILVSPAQRTLQTAEALELEFEICPQLAPTATASELMAAAGWPGAGGAVLLVGHQPNLGRLASTLLVGTELDLEIKKGAVWWFTRDRRGGEGETVLRTAISAERLR